MAEGLLRSYLARAGVPATVGSAGLLPGGAPATADAIAVMASRGIDLRGHRSRTLEGAIVHTAALVIGMTRQHVREACVTYGAPIERTFTLKELVRRGEHAGARAHGETVSAWLARVGAGRHTSGLLGRDPADDVADPVGQARGVYERTVLELDDLLVRLVTLLVGDPGVPSGGVGSFVGPTSGEHGIVGPATWDHLGGGPPTGEHGVGVPVGDGLRPYADSYADTYGGRHGDRGR